MNVDILKAQARRLSKQLLSNGFEVKLSHAYEGLAAVYGERDWNTLLARASADNPDSPKSAPVSAASLLTPEEAQVWAVFEDLLKNKGAKPPERGHRALCYWFGRKAFIREVHISTLVAEALPNVSRYEASTLLLSGLKKQGWLDLTPMGPDAPSWHLWDVSVKYNANQGGLKIHGVWVLNVPGHIEVTARSCASVAVVHLRFGIKSSTISKLPLPELPKSAAKLSVESPLEYAAGIRPLFEYQDAREVVSMENLPEVRPSYLLPTEGVKPRSLFDALETPAPAVHHTLVLGSTGIGKSRATLERIRRHLGRPKNQNGAEAVSTFLEDCTDEERDQVLKNSATNVVRGR